MEEYKIGEVFQFGKIKLKCVEVSHNHCSSCFLYDFSDCGSCVGECFFTKRSDRKNVIFIEVKEEDHEDNERND